MARHLLLARTALTGTAALLAAAAAALPGAPATVAFSTGGSAPVITNPDATTLDIDFNAARTVLQFNGFEVLSGDTVNLRFDARSDIGIIHNVGQNALAVDGVLRSYVGAQFGGNVWLLSSAGVLFGANAAVDVGGLLAATAVPSNLLDPQGPFLDPLNLNFDFSGGSASIATTGGGRITGHGGTLALIAPSVSTALGTSVTGGGDTSVLYGAAQSYTVRFVRETGNDLDLLDFEVPGLTAGGIASLPLQIAGTTTAGNIYLASVSQVATVGSVLLAEGNLTATSAGIEGGNIVLTAGGGIAARAAAPLFTDGNERHVISAPGNFTADRNITVQATGNIALPGTVSADGILAITGVNLSGGTLAGQDIVLRAGDAIGSTATGYGYGYGHYGPSGGSIDFVAATARDDFAATAWNGGIALASVVLAGLGVDTAGDPLGLLDAAGDGRRLLLRTTGSSGDIIFGIHNEGPTDTLSGGTDTRLEAVGMVSVRSSGDVTLTAVTSRDRIVDLKVEGSLTVGTVTARGLVLGSAGEAIDIGSATALQDGNANGSVVLRAASVSLDSGSAYGDVLVVADEGDAIVGTATAGDDIIVRARGGTAQLGSATIMLGEGGGPDRDANRFVETILFEDLNVDADDNGRRVDLGSVTLVKDKGATRIGGDVRLGIDNGSVIDAGAIIVDAERDAYVDLLPATILTRVTADGDATIAAAGVTVEELFAGNDATVTARTGDAHVLGAEVGNNLTVTAAAGLASLGGAGVGNAVTLSGHTVSVGDIIGFGGNERAHDITIGSTADLTIAGLEVDGSLVLTSGGAIAAVSLFAAGSINVTAATSATFGSSGEVLVESEAPETPFRFFEPQLSAGLDLIVDAATIEIRSGMPVSIGRDLTLTATRVEAAVLTAGRSVVVAAADIALGEVFAGNGEAGDIVLTGGTVAAGYLQASRDISVTATGAANFGRPVCITCESTGLDASGNIVVSAASLGFEGLLRAAGDLDLTITGVAGFTSIDPLDAGRDLTVDAAGVLALGTARAQRDVRLIGAGVAVDLVSAGGDAFVTARSGDALVTQARTPQDLIVLAAAGLAAIGDAGVGRDLTLSGATATLGVLHGFVPAGYGYGYGYGTPIPTRDIAITASAGDFFYTGELAAGGDLRLTVSGMLGVGGPTSALGDAVIDVGSATFTELRAARDLTVTARTGTLTATDDLYAGDDLRLTAPTLALRGVSVMTAHGDNEADGRTISLSGGSATLTSATAPDRFTATLTGQLTTGNSPVVAAAIVIDAGSIARTTTTASTAFDGGNGVTLRATGAVTTGGLRSTGGAVVVEAGGAVGLAGLDAATDGRVTGASVTVGTVAARRDAVLIAASGDASVGTAVIERDLRVVAANGLAAIGSATVGRDFGLDGARVQLGSLGPYLAGYGYGQTPTRDIRIAATAGDISFDGALAATRDLTVSASGAIALGASSAGRDALVDGDSVTLTSLAATRDLTLTARTGALIATGLLSSGDDLRLTAPSMTLATLAAASGDDSEGDGGNIVLSGGDATLDAASAADLFGASLSGTLTTGAGSVDAGRILVTAGAVARTVSDASTAFFGSAGVTLITVGAVDTGRLGSASGIVAIDAGGGVRLRGQINAPNVDIAGHSVMLDGNVVALGRVTVMSRVGDVAAAGLDADGDVNVTATGGLSLVSSRAGDDVMLAAGGALTATGAIVAGRTLQNGLGTDSEGDGYNIRISGGAVSLAGLDAPTDIVVTGGSIVTGLVAARRDASIVALTGEAEVSSAAVKRDLRVVAADGLAWIGDATVGQDVLLGGARAQLGSLAAYVESGGYGYGSTLLPTRDIRIVATAGDFITTGNLVAARDLDVSVSGNLTLGNASAGDDARLRGAAVLLDAVTASGSGGDSEGDGAGIVIDAASLVANRLDALDDVRIVASGDATLAQSGTARDFAITAASLIVGEIDATRDIVLTATAGGIGSIDETHLEAGNDLRIDARDAVDIGNASAVRDLSVIGAEVFAATLSAGRDLGANARSGIVQVASLGAGDDVRLAGSSVRIFGALSTGAATDTEGDGSKIVATGGDIRIDAAQAFDDLSVIASGIADIGTVGGATAGRDVLVTGGTLVLGSLGAGRDLALIATASDFAAAGLSAVRNLTVGAAGLLSFDSAVAGGDVTLTGVGIAGGTVTAGGDATLDAGTGLLSAALIRAGDDIRLSGLTIDVGQAYADGEALDDEGDGADIVAGGGTITLEIAVAAGDVLVAGSGAVALGIGSDGGATGAGRAYFAAAGGDIVATGASLLAGPLDAGRDVRLGATAGANDARGVIAAGRDLTLDASGALSFGDVAATRHLGLAGASLSGGNASAGGDVTATARTGGIALANVSAGDDVRLTAALDMTLFSVLAFGSGIDSEGDGANIFAGARAITLAAAAAATDVVIDATGDLIASGTGSAVGSGRDIVLSGASVTVGNALAVRDLRLHARSGDISASSVTGERDLIADASGTLQFGDLTAARDLILTGASLEGGTARAGRNVTATGRSGGLGIGDISAGDDVRLDAAHDIALGSVAATGLGTDSEADGASIVASGRGITLASATAAADVRLTATAALSIADTGGTIVAGRDAVLSAASLGPAGITAGRDLSLTATASGIADGDLAAIRNLSVTATGALSFGTANAGGAMAFFAASISGTKAAAGTDLTATATGALSLANATAAGDIGVAGATVGGALQLAGRDISVTSGDAFTATAGLVAARDLRLTAGTTLSFAQLTAGRDLILIAPVVQGGTALAARDLTVIATTRITGDRFEARRNLILDPDEAITAGIVRAAGDATLIGRSIEVGVLDVGGVTFAQATGGSLAFDSFTGRGAATLLATGKVTFGAATTAAVRIIGGDFDVRRTLVASSLQVETPGRMVLGGAEDTGFSLAASDIARLRVAGQTSFYAGVTGTSEGVGASGDLIVRDFAYNPVDLPRLALFADRSHVVDIQGKILPSITGGIVQIGDSSATGRFRPGSIYVSGSFGSAELDVNCFGSVVAVGALAFYAVDDVIFGLTDFRAAVRAAAAEAIDVADGFAGVAGPADNRLFAVATRFTVDAAGKIVSQNTASNTGNYTGLFFNGSGASTPIVALGNARAIDLSGSLVDARGNLRSGPTVAFAGELGSGPPNGNGFRFNGCFVGGTACGAGGGGATPAEALRVEDYTPPRPVELTDTPLSTVLVADQDPTGIGALTIGTEDGGIVIRRREP